MVEMGVLTAETAVIWGNTLANLANLASNPFTWVALAVAIAVIGGLIIGLSNHTKATE
jgi:hypothetical protein